MDSGVPAGGSYVNLHVRLLRLSGPPLQGERPISHDKRHFVFRPAHFVSLATLFDLVDRRTRILPVPLEKDLLGGARRTSLVDGCFRTG